MFKKDSELLCRVFAIIGAIVGAILLFYFWGLEWYQENDMEWQYGIFNIVFLAIHLMPFFVTVVGGGICGFFIGGFMAVAIEPIIAILCTTEVDASGAKKILTKPRKVLLIIVVVMMLIPAIFITSNMKEKQKIKNEITNYLSSEFSLKDIEIKFTEPYSDTWKYGVDVYSSNLDSLSYEQMTRIEYYLTSHTALESGDVLISRYICGNDIYKIFTTTVYKNGDCVYEYQKSSSSSITSAAAPYYGMNTDYIGSTKLGSPDKTELCRDYYSLRPERRSITYKWYDSNGEIIYYAYAINGKVTSVVDYR